MSNTLYDLNRYFNWYKKLYPEKPVSLISVGIMIHYVSKYGESYIDGYSIVDQKKFDNFVLLGSLL